MIPPATTSFNGPPCPPAFFETVLGPHLKYSGAWWPEGVRTLAEAEEAMLALTVERAAMVDGQSIPELGCAWGPLTLYMARRFPDARITAVSNSGPQRRFIESRAPSNVRVITADMNELDLDGRFFVHVFCHRSLAYPFEAEGTDNWMGRHFFTGGIMPSFDLLAHFDDDVEIEASWPVEGTHYERTARAWRKNLEARREELFGYRHGTEWLVGHYRFRPRI